MNNFPFVFLLIATLLFVSTASSATAVAATSLAPSPTLSTSGCDAKCGNRCALAGYKERCLKYCGLCCGKCQGCVPSGPKAEKSECPCYRDLKNSKGKAKCP